jgi:hypothetical protein
LKSLFSDDRRAILRQILNASLDEAEAAYRQIYERHVPLAHFLRDLGVPLPKAIRTAAEFAVNNNLRCAFANDEMEVEQVRKMLDEARSGGVDLDSTTLEYALRHTIDRLFAKFAAAPKDSALMERLEAIVEMARSLPFEVMLWTPQNVWWEVRGSLLEGRSQSAQAGDQEARAWVEHFLALGEKLQVRVAAVDAVLSHSG